VLEGTVLYGLVLAQYTPFW